LCQRITKEIIMYTTTAELDAFITAERKRLAYELRFWPWAIAQAKAAGGEPAAWGQEGVSGNDTEADGFAAVPPANER
jgi:hypothetical protein